MKKLIYLLTLSLFVFTSCDNNSEMIDLDSAEKQSPKVDVCHYDADTDTWKTINISENALEAHRKHGDKYDWDGDGYYPENECGIGEGAGYDCDDTNANYHEEIRRFKDNDGDGFGDKTTRLKSCVPDPNYDWVLNGNDCDDTDASVNPSADEICGDGIDNNCNGEIDENCDDPCLDEAINQVSALIQGQGGIILNITKTSSNTFLIFWDNSGVGGRGCTETTAEATGDPETSCGYTNLQHNSTVPCP